MGGVDWQGERGWVDGEVADTCKCCLYFVCAFVYSCFKQRSMTCKVSSEAASAEERILLHCDLFLKKESCCIVTYF